MMIHAQQTVQARVCYNKHAAPITKPITKLSGLSGHFHPLTSMPVVQSRNAPAMHAIQSILYSICSHVQCQ